MAKSEETWLEGARRLDEKVLGEIYDRLSPELYRYAYRLVGDADQAEDLLSETFLRFLRAIQSGVGPKTHLRAYLYRIVHNLVMDHHRRGEPCWSALGPEELPSRDVDNPTSIVGQRLEAQRARSLLWHLTSEQRQVILLRFFQGMSNMEVANVLNKTEGAVKALQHRGLATLRRLIEQEALDQEQASG